MGTKPDRTEEWADLRSKYLQEPASRPASSARGVHHVALLCTDVETTIKFYSGVLGFPLTDLFENRDYEGSTHFFFDIGNGNALAFFDFPDLGLAEYSEVLGSLHHIAISITPERMAEVRVRMEEANVAIDFEHLTSVYFRGPDGERVELISDPLGHMYGQDVL